MNAHWKFSELAVAVEQDTAVPSQESFWERAEEFIGRYGMFVIAAGLFGALLVLVPVELVHEYDKCFMNTTYIIDCIPVDTP